MTDTTLATKKSAWPRIGIYVILSLLLCFVLGSFTVWYTLLSIEAADFNNASSGVELDKGELTLDIPISETANPREAHFYTFQAARGQEVQIVIELQQAEKRVYIVIFDEAREN